MLNLTLTLLSPQEWKQSGGVKWRISPRSSWSTTKATISSRNGRWIKPRRKQTRSQTRHRYTRAMMTVYSISHPITATLIHISDYVDVLNLLIIYLTNNQCWVIQKRFNTCRNEQPSVISFSSSYPLYNPTFRDWPRFELHSS